MTTKILKVDVHRSIPPDATHHLKTVVGVYHSKACPANAKGQIELCDCDPEIKVLQSAIDPL